LSHEKCASSLLLSSFAHSMAPLTAVVCVVTGAGGLEHDAQALLASALEKAGVAAALATGGPNARGAAPSAAGRNVALLAFDYASGLRVLYAPTEAPLDLRRWVLAARAAAAPPAAPNLLSLLSSAAASAAPRPGASAALDALEALLDERATAAWLPSSGAQVTILAPSPADHVSDDLLQPLLAAANARLFGVCFAVVAPPMGATLGRSVEEELRAKHAALSLAAAVAAADNGAFRAVACTPAAADALALSLLFPERTPAGAPRVRAEICLPAPLTAAGGAQRRLHVALRPEVLPLHDAVERIRVCACHGRGMLSRDSTIGADDLAHFLTLAGKNNVCCVSAKGLTPAQWHPNCISLGRDAVLHLPSFYAPPFALSSSGSGGGASGSEDDVAAARGSGFGGDAAAALNALACVPLAAVSESQLFGTPWVARPADDDDEEDEGDDDDVGAGGGSVSNSVVFAALCGALAARGSGLLLASQHNLDTGKSTPFRCMYIAIPAAPTPVTPTAAHGSADSGGGGVNRTTEAAADDDGVDADAPPPAAGPPQLLLKRIVAREELLPPLPPAASPAVPPALAEEVARSLAASLPDIVGPFDPLSYERGTHRVLAQLVGKSLAPPPRSATHEAEAEAAQARERYAARKSSKPDAGGGKAKRKGQ
jgi:hypothetical protein